MNGMHGAPGAQGMHGGGGFPPQQGVGIDQSVAPGGHVGAQQAVGVNHGHVTQIGGDQYVVNPDATPQERYEKGRRLLDAGLRVWAEELIGDAVAQRLSTPEVLYYWALSIVSRRAVEDLTPEDMQKLHAVEHLLGASQDPYAQAARVVLLMLNEAFGHVPSGSADELASRRGEAASSDTAAAALGDERQSELRDHLRHFGSEIMRERGAAAEERDIAEHRMDSRRQERVPLFFEPDPLPPVEVTQIGVLLKFRFKVMAAAGGLLFLAGLVVGVPAMFRGSVGAAIVALLLCAAGGPLAARFGADRVWLRRRAKIEDFWFERGGPLTRRHVLFLPDMDPGEATGRQAAFVHSVAEIVTRHFAAQPRPGEDRDGWWAATVILRDDLTLELSDMYGPDADPYGLDWLIRKYAEETAERWRAGLLTGLRPRRTVPFAVHAGWFGGLALLVIGTLAALSAAVGDSAGTAAQAAALWALGGYLGVKGGVPFRHEHLRRAVDREAIRARFADEQQAYAAWRAFLDAHQPRDWEMGRWLNYDMRYLRREALVHYDLRPQQIVYDFFVLEAGDDARRARVRNGPMRYSVYRIRLYVMTERGIRLATWSMDFAEGVHHGRSDTSQRYESISSVKVDRASIQLTDRQAGFQQAVTVLPDGSIRGNPERGELMLSEELVIERDSSHETRLRVENYTRIQRREFEDLRHLLELSQEASGISTASRILVAVAAEGREWFEEQRKRNSRRFAESKQQQPASAEVKYLVPPPSSDPAPALPAPRDPDQDHDGTAPAAG